MPLIPSFSAYPAQPNLAEAYLGGQRIALGREQIAQQAAEASQRASIAREQIAANQVENQMRLQAQQQMLQQKMLQEQHQAEVQQAYNQARLGLAEREVTNQEARMQMQLEEAARELTAQQDYFRMTEGGVPPAAAARRTGYVPRGATVNLEPPTTRTFAPPRETAGDRALKLKILENEKEEAIQKFGFRTPEWRTEIDRINKKIEALFPPTPPPAPAALPVPPGVAAPPPVAAPAAAAVPQPYSIFMGTPPGTPPTMSNAIPLNPQYGVAPTAATPVTSPGLTIPSGIAPATARRRVWNAKTGRLE